MSKSDLFPRYFNRELSWIEFNRRVLNEALRPEKPLLERLKFLAIVSSNFDEFFMVRVASIKRQQRDGNYITCPSGMSPSRQLQEIRKQVRSILETQYRCLLADLLPKMAEQGIMYHAAGSFSENQLTYLQRFFNEQVFPLLTPVRFVPGESYTNFGNIRLHIAFLLQKADGVASLVNDEHFEQVAIVQIPSSISRTVYLPEQGDKTGFTFMETLIVQYAAQLFPGFTVREHLLFRITRDADMGVDESEDEDFVQAMEQILTRREHSTVVRLTVGKTSAKLRAMLQQSLGLEDSELFDVDEPLDPTGFFEIASLKSYDHLRFEAQRPCDPLAFPEDESMFEAIRKRDALLNLPFESFAPVVRLVQEAAADPSVLAIKMTLYRTSGDSPIVAALEQAAQSGKQVTVLVEIKARFDEARNISWAERLTKAGVIVVYGIAQLKVHAKALLIMRRENGGVKRYLHLSTGNYNDKTARLYSDLSFFTCRDDLCYEAGLFFNAITGYSAIPVLNKLVMAPNALKPKLLKLIEREVAKSSEDNPGSIVAKMNSLVDIDIVEALYAASQANVRIRLNVRGICMLVPGIPGRSEHIRVTSIIDRYLEHTRAFHFRNGGQDEIYCSSADWMPRNLEGRVELMFPVEQEDLKERIKSMLDLYMRDNCQSSELQADGQYRPVQSGPGEAAVQAQTSLFAAACEINRKTLKTDRKTFNVRRKPPRA